MICCVIGGALAAMLIARLSKLPLLGAWFGRLQRQSVDPSHWRLNTDDKQL